MFSGKKSMAWQTKNMNADQSHPNHEFYHLWLECSQAYDIIVLAWNERGHSDFDRDSMVTVTTENGKHLFSSNKGNTSIIIVNP